MVLWPFTIGAFDGEIKINLTDHPQSCSVKEAKMHKKIFPKIEFDGSQIVKVNNLDSWHKSILQSEPIGLDWCDVNGAEVDFVKVATQTLKISKYLFIEFEEVELFEGALNRDIISLKLPGWSVINEYNLFGNYGNLLSKNNNFQHNI